MEIKATIHSVKSKDGATLLRWAAIVRRETDDGETIQSVKIFVTRKEALDFARAKIDEMGKE